MDGRRSGVDWTAKTFLYQARNPSAVIQVRVRQNDRINVTRWNGSVLPVALAPFLRSLKKATVDQDLESLVAARIIGCVDQVLGAGHGAGCTEKLDIGQELSPGKNGFQSFNVSKLTKNRFRCFTASRLQGFKAAERS